MGGAGNDGEIGRHVTMATASGGEVQRAVSTDVEDAGGGDPALRGARLAWGEREAVRV